jgi:hypothetical protein
LNKVKDGPSDAQHTAYNYDDDRSREIKSTVTGCVGRTR